MKMRKMFQYCLVLLLAFGCIRPTKVQAEADFYFYVDDDEVEVGDTVTFTIGVDGGAGNIDLSGDYNESGLWLEDSSESFTVTATEEGTISVTASGLIGDFETEEDIEIYETITVSVSKPEEEYTPDPTPEPEPDEDDEEEEEEKSDDARLWSLSVDKGTLTPSFESDVYEYTVELTSDYNEITIDAECWDDNASLKGDGLKVLKVGSNSFTVDVTAEDGKTRQAYTINVKVKEIPSVFIDFNDKELGILNEVENADIPKGFTETTIRIDNKDVKAFVNAQSNMTLLFMVDEDDNKGFYVYDQEKGICGLYRPITIDGKDFYVVNVPEALKTMEEMNFVPLTVGTETVDGWSFKNVDYRNYSVLYLMDTKGKVGYYVYDSLTSKIAAYPEESKLTAEDLIAFIEKKPSTPWLLYAGIAGAVIVVGGIVAFVILKKKKQKDDDDDYYDEDIEPMNSRESGHKLVTDDTFFKDVPSDKEDEVEEERMPLIIENALNDLDRIALDEEDGDKEEPVEEEPMTETDVDDEDDDWLDEKMLDIFTSDDE